MSDAQRYLMISADCHAGPPMPGFREYMGSTHRAAFDDYCRSRPNIAVADAALRGDLDAVAGTLGAFMRATGGSPAAVDSFCARAAEMTGGLFDSKVRNECLDDEGIAGEVIFTDGFVENHPPFSDMMQSEGALFAGRHWSQELREAGARAYNRWLADFCSESPERRAGVVFLPPAHDVPAIVEELRWCREAGLRGGLLIPPLDEGLPGYADPHYDPIWSAAVDLDMPVTVHGGNAKAPDGATIYGTQEPLASVMHFTECAFFDRRPLWFFIWGGVFERFPALKLVFAEGLAHWVPEELQRLDEMYDMWNMQVLRQKLSLRPSEYWQRNCFVTATFISRAEAELRHEIHVPNLLWGSDYPHPEGTWPYTRTCLRHAFEGVPEAELRSILGSTAVDLYGFDAAALRPLADRIGPLPSDVDGPRGDIPADYLGMGMR